jgi:hypothetical protein
MTSYREYRPELASEGMLAPVRHYPHNDARLVWAMALMDGAEFLLGPTKTVTAEWESAS